MMKLSFRRAIILYTLIPVTFIFVIFALENIYTTRQNIHQRIENHMTDLAYSYASLFNEVLNPVAGIANTTADLLYIDRTIQADDIYKILRLHVEHNPIIYGAWVTYAPYQFDQQKKLFAPYVFRQGDSIKQIDAVSDTYDYTDGSHEFWNKPVTMGKGVWTEPYFDEGAGNIMMSSYAVPFYHKGKLLGVTGIDMPLHDISEKIHIPGVKEHNVTVLSETGNLILFPDSQYIGKSIYTVIDKGFNARMAQSTEQQAELLKSDKQDLETLVQAMMSGKSGKADLTGLTDDHEYWYFYAPIKTPGWSFSIRVDESEIFSDVYDRLWYSLFFFALLLVLITIAIFLVSGKFSSSIAWLVERCLRIERMNFQQAKDDNYNINEVTQLSTTLDSMCAALNTHFSVKEDVRIAKAIRQQTLPTKMRYPAGFQFCVWSQANDESCGETYDSVDYWRSSYSEAKKSLGQKAEGTAYILLDTPDKGIDSAVKNTHLRAIFSAYAKLGVDLVDTVQYMNNYLISDLALPGPVQAWFGMVDNKGTCLSCISLGLNAVFYYSANDHCVSIVPNYPYALSMQKNMTELTLQQIKLAPNDFIIVASDGVWGAINERREQFGLQALKTLILNHCSEDAEKLLAVISQSIERHTGNRSKKANATVMLIKRNAVDN